MGYSSYYKLPICSYFYDRYSRFSRLESNGNIIKFYIINVNFDFINEYTPHCTKVACYFPRPCFTPKDGHFLPKDHIFHQSIFCLKVALYSPNLRFTPTNHILRPKMEILHTNMYILRPKMAILCTKSVFYTAISHLMPNDGHFTPQDGNLALKDCHLALKYGNSKDFFHLKMVIVFTNFVFYAHKSHYTPKDVYFMYQISILHRNASFTPKDNHFTAQRP